MRAETTIYRARVRRRRRSVVALRRGLVAAALLLSAVAIVGVLFAGSRAVLAPGTTISGVDVGGLNAQAAESKLRAREHALARTPVTFVAAGKEFRYSASQLGVEANWRAAIAAARQDGDGFWPLRAFRRLHTRLFGSDLAPRVTAYHSALDYAVAQIASTIDAEQVDASLVRHGLEISIDPGSPGRALEQPAAASAIVQTLGSLAHPARVVLGVREHRQRVTAVALARAAREARVALSAPVRLRYAGTVWRLPRWRLAELVRLPLAGATRLAIAGPAAQAYFGRLAATVERRPVDARLRLLAGNHVGIVPSKPGLALDIGRTSSALLAAALSPADRTAELAVAVLRPHRTSADARAMGIRGVVSSFSTTYGGTPGRLHNVALVARLIDGALIAPGTTFSFNGTTGARTAAKGFEVAPVIINGELQNGLGGGVCQVSTTVYNAAFFAGVPITQRVNHGLYISHYPLGRDATVDYPGIDLKFRNDTKHWLWLRTVVGSGSLTVTLYGTPQHRRVEYDTAPLTAAGSTRVKVVKDPTLKKGKRIVEEQGAPPRTTSVRRRVYDAHGKLLYDTTWRSSYVGETGVVRVGTKKPAPKTAADVASPFTTALGAGATPAAFVPAATPRPAAAPGR